MRRICAWCRAEIEQGEAHADAGNISHGICRRCADNIQFQEGVALTEYIESLAVPVVVINSSGAVHAANRKAGETIARKFRNAGSSKRTGDVFECQYARLPEGCGSTVHCSGCAIRRSVDRTLTTGEPQCRVPATLRRKVRENYESISLVITTVKVEDGVLVKIEEE